MATNSSSQVTTLNYNYKEVNMSILPRNDSTPKVPYSGYTDIYKSVIRSICLLQILRHENEKSLSSILHRISNKVSKDK